jgi:outer membrane lipoprotein-sorting protein
VIVNFALLAGIKTHMRMGRKMACSAVLVLPLSLSMLGLALNSSGSAPNAPLPVEQVAKKLEERNAFRAAALAQFHGTRTYRMQYFGFPGQREAEMVVKVTYRAPDTKEFTIVSQSGSKYIVDHVLKKLLQDEQDCSKGDARRSIELNTQNYKFSFAGYEPSKDGDQYVLNVVPKTSNRFLYRGKIWVDAKDFAVTRIEAEPARSPSWWISKTKISHKYAKIDDFWLPLEDRTESSTRMGGRAILTIEYTDYKITRAAGMAALGESQPAAK